MRILERDADAEEYSDQPEMSASEDSRPSSIHLVLVLPASPVSGRPTTLPLQPGR